MGPMLDKSAPIAMLVGMAAAAARNPAPAVNVDTSPASRRQSHKAYAKKAMKAVQNLEHYAIVEKMTNWQRNQWQRAGGSLDLETLKHYAALERPKQ